MKIVVLLLAGLYSSVLFAERITLKNGTVLQGSVSTMTESEVVIDTAELGRVSIKRYNIQSIQDQPTVVTSPLPQSNIVKNVRLTPSTVEVYRRDPLDDNGLFFGLGLAANNFSGGIWASPMAYDFTLLGYNARNGFQISIHAEISEDSVSGGLPSLEDAADLYAEGMEYKKLFVEASFPVFDWRMFGTRSLIRLGLSAGMMDFRVIASDYEHYDTGIDGPLSEYNAIGDVFSEYSGRAGFGEVAAEYALRFNSTVELHVGANLGFVAFAEDKKKRAETGTIGRDNGFTPNMVDLSEREFKNWLSISGGLRVLI